MSYIRWFTFWVSILNFILACYCIHMNHALHNLAVKPCTLQTEPGEHCWIIFPGSRT